MPPTTRAMTARGIAAPEVYAVRPKRVRNPGPPRPTLRRRRFKPKPASTKTMHGEIGFDRQELQDSGALEALAAESPTLANEILGLFHKKKFIFEGGAPPAEWDEAYENMKPAFRLASRWILDPAFRKFWNSLGRGKVEDLDHPREDFLRPKRKVEFEGLGEGEIAAAAEDTPGCFERYARQHHFRFRPVQHAWALTRSQSVPTPPDRFHWVPTQPDRFNSVTILHDDFYYLSYTTFPKATESQQLRFLYFLAINLAHEMAHLLWQHREAKLGILQYSGSILDSEPFRFDCSDPHNELGISWECFMFGGRIQPLNQCATPFVPDGLAILHLDMVRDTLFTDIAPRIAPLLTDWISDQFAESWWNKRGRKAALARRPGRPGRALVRATVNRTTDSNVFLTNTYVESGDAAFVADHIVGGSPGHRLVQTLGDTWLLTGVAGSLWNDVVSEGIDG